MCGVRNTPQYLALILLATPTYFGKPKNFAQLGFTSQRLGKEELKTLLAVYYEQNVTTDTFEDVDGERWLLNEDV